jgi:DNA-directed RNA polymerase specialized sigma24 family protein
MPSPGVKEKEFSAADELTATKLMKYNALEIIALALDGVPAKPQEPITDYTWRGLGNGND